MDKLYGGEDLETIRQSPRQFGEVAVIEDMADEIQRLRADKQLLVEQNTQLRDELQTREAELAACKAELEATKGELARYQSAPNAEVNDSIGSGHEGE